MAASGQDVLSVQLEQKFGLRNLKSDWVRRQTAFSADILTGPICRTDICEITKGSLPWNILAAHSVQLDTKVLVQIEDIINIASSNPRSMDAPRVLQFALTDGSVDFIAVELEPLSSRISMRTLPGTKLVLHPSTLIRRGRALLTEKDYTLLGSPPTNIWGASYDQKVSEALTAARLQNPSASSFDSIARSTAPTSGTAAPENLALRNLPDMGGIADAVPSASNDESDDDQFWAHAAAVADLSEAQAVGLSMGASCSRSELQHQARSSSGVPMQREEPPIQRNIPPSTTVPSVPAASSPRIGNTNQSRVGSEANVVPDIIKIPAMPVFESDPGINDISEEKVELIEADPFNDLEESDFFEIPELPLSRFDALPAIRISSEKRSVFRAFVSRPKSKFKIDRERDEVLLTAQFDDGSATTSLLLRQRFLERLSRIALPRTDTLPPGICSFEDDLSDRSRLLQVRKACRGIAAFIHVEHEQEMSSITQVTKEPPGGFVSICECTS